MSLGRTPLAVDDLPPGVRRATDPGASPAARLAAARGMLPMGPRDLCVALYQLSLDADAKVAQAAAATAEGLPDGILEQTLGAPLDARVLDFFAERLRNRSKLIERIVLNPATHADTICDLARTVPERLCEAIAVNEERIFRAPAIIEALYLNRAARMSTVDRLIEDAARRGITLGKIPTASRPGAAGPPPGAAAEPAPPVEAVTAAASGDGFGDEAFETPGATDVDGLFGEALSFGEEFGEDGGGDVVDAMLEEFAADKAQDRSADHRMRRITDLPISAKMRLATIGNAFHRSVLIRERNKIIALAAVNSPAVTDAEAVRFASMRSVEDDVIRVIAKNREWLRLYGVKKNLVNNPKCPLPEAMRLLPHLRPVDLKAVATSKNIPAALATAAKRMVEQRKGGAGEP